MSLNEAVLGEEYIIRDISTDDEELDAFLFSLGCYSGRSTAVSSKSPENIFRIGASLRSTVTPAQLPTFSLRPVRALYIVVLPLLGLPANAIFILVSSESGVSLS